MKELKTLVKIVTDRRLDTLPLLNFSESSSPGKDFRLIRMLDSPTVITQTQLVKGLYGGTDTKSAASFRKLKSRVQQKLLNQLYFLDQSDPRHLAVKKYDQKCLSTLHQAKILVGEGEYKLAEKLFRKALRLAEEAEFTHYSILGFTILRKLYVEMNNPARFRWVNQQLQDFLAKQLLENEAEQLYVECKIALNDKVQYRRFILDQLPQIIERLEAIHQEVNSYNTFHPLYTIRLMKEELQGNYTEIIRLTSEVEQLCQQGKINLRRLDKRFNNYISVFAHLHNKQAEQGLQLAEEYFKNFHYSSGNWFYFLETYLLLAIHAHNYSTALALLQQAHQNPYFNKQRDAAQQRWELYEAYLQFIKPAISPLKMRAFSQFVQKVPSYSRDKQGQNVAILILQFLYFLNTGDIDGFTARLDALRKYEQRHLRDPATLRTQLFFRLIFMSMKEGFDMRRVAPKAQPLLERLRATPHPGQAYGEIEIIPYEHLWDLIVNILRRQERAVGVK
ncbi:hypothetical protein KLP40_14435 [Hymenobacter sp. NST-14]|uniref:hypothetical protein n=1 Tax=Hymenobacter piscis TaxID=2839984 RepID=UPI001C02A57A|nr:hypothetical protein [Hymenobacter piscis]MBT9394365.1 hypothetical protein [Hymenobacter piscis]